MQSMWAGTLAFGPVTIPVRLGPATRPRELAFRQVHAADGGRITLRRSCTVCGADVPYADVAKAYQRPDGDLVPVTDEELASLPLEAGRRIDVLGFVAPGAIDPLLVSRSYFLTPDPAHDPAHDLAHDPAHGTATTQATHATQSYGLFHAALELTGQIAVASITLRQREARATVWPRGSALVLQTLLTPDEIADPGLPSQPSASSNGAGPPGDAPDPAQQPGQQPGQQPDLAQLAQQIAAMTRDFDPAAHHDGYRDQLEALIQRK
jgi:DNA end-binding protein Ku